MELPRDVLHYELFPLLDYSTRISLNQVLPRAERKAIPLKKEVLKEFSTLFARCMIQRLMQSMMNDTPLTLLQNCRDFDQSYFGCFVNFPTFRMRFMLAVVQLQWNFSTWESPSKRVMTELNEFLEYCTVACESAASVTESEGPMQPMQISMVDDALWDLGFV